MSVKNLIAKRLPVILTVLAIALAIALSFWLKSMLFSETVEQKKMVQQITVLAPPPPPPPPPPEIEEPEIEEEVIEEELEESLPDESLDEPSSEGPAVDAEGAAGGDSYLQGRPGGGNFRPRGYHSVINTEIQKALLSDDTLKFMAYLAEVEIRVGADGSFESIVVEVLEGEIDIIRRELERFLNEMGGITKPKPLAEKNNRFKFRFSSSI